MKNLTLKLEGAEMLTKEQMKKVTGGEDPSGCVARCDQDTDTTTSVSDCSAATVRSACGSDDLSNTVCVCTP